MLQILAAVFAGFGLCFLVLGLRALRRRRPLRSAFPLASAVALLALGALVLTLGFGVRGYRALTHEALAAVVEVVPADGRSFEAAFRFPDGRRAHFRLLGDELYVDAHILKWKPLGNLIGLHTAYELDRVAGRYADLADEKRRPRSVYSLAAERPVDLFDLRRRFASLSLLVDAEYGSATFIVANRPASFEVRVSTTGLLIRRRASQ